MAELQVKVASHERCKRLGAQVVMDTTLRR